MFYFSESKGKVGFNQLINYKLTKQQSNKKIKYNLHLMEVYIYIHINIYQYIQ